MATQRDLPGKKVQIETAGSMPSVGQVFVTEARRRLSQSQEKIRHCLEQLDDAQLWWRPNESMNSIANLVLHLCGNLRQWIISGAGGAADVRNRPQEFAERKPLTRTELLRRLDAVALEADTVLSKLDDATLVEVRRIQGGLETVLGAIFDSLAHLNGHTQEIVHLTRLQKGENYRFAWTPATAEQAAVAVTEPKKETVELRDAVFGEMPSNPLHEGATANSTLPPLMEIVPFDMPPDPRNDTGSRPEASLKDYLLDLEQEFQEDEERGKV